MCRFGRVTFVWRSSGALCESYLIDEIYVFLIIVKFMVSLWGSVSAKFRGMGYHSGAFNTNGIL